MSKPLNPPAGAASASLAQPRRSLGSASSTCRRCGAAMDCAASSSATWLGWEIESNWADPFLFAVYSIVRPVASVLILVVMYSVITQGAFQEPIFPYIYLGNALYILVGQIITGVSWAIIDDREHYRVAKHLYTAPISGYTYLFGRGVARLIIGAISVIITVGFGMIVFKLPIRLGSIDWALAGREHARWA